MAQKANPIDAKVKDALCRARRRRLASLSSNAGRVTSVRRALQGITSSSPIFSPFEAIQGLLPFSFGLIDTLSFMNPNEPTNFVYNVPDGFLAARAKLIGDDPAIPLATSFPDRLALRGTDVLTEEFFRTNRYIKSLYPQFGLNNVTGMILTPKESFGRGDRVVLWLFSGDGADVPTWEACGLLDIICDDIWEAFERMNLPISAHQKLFLQTSEEQDEGYIVLRLDGTLLEANQRAVMLCEKYASLKGGPWRSVVDDFLSATSIRPHPGSPPMSAQLFHPDGISVLDLKAHLLRKEHYCISEDVTLIRMTETQWDLPAAVIRGEGEFAKLTPKEREVLVQRLITGGAYKQIAPNLSKKEGTIRSQMQAIHKKLRVQSFGDLIVLARRRGQKPSSS
ncbi:MAG TPA: helix-turn-helix transcriptional regulator [Polyangiaceae bacterium]|jgi:DNA-binding CsgD family transcriptional regulator|nr:helix-turn-helix transcriptional regulator [Polyangiaceae bacterium]